MSDEVEVPFGDNPSDTATLLLAAADKLELDPGVVRTGSNVFMVPKDVADEAGVDYEGDDSSDKPTAKKSSAKKSS
jgi:hypothetical protein